MSDQPPLTLLILGTDTNVGKTWVTCLLARGLTARGRRVWVHKPIACGGWDGTSSDDGRTLRALAQEMASDQPLDTVCPREFPEPASPHLAAAAAGAVVTLAEMRAALQSVMADARRYGADLLIESAGGLLSPLTCERATIVEVVRELGLPALLVTRSHLGTLNHTALTVRVAKAEDLPLIGLVVNHHPPVLGDLATRTAAGDLYAITGRQILAELPHGTTDGANLTKQTLARLA